MPRISSVPVGLYRLQGKSASKFFEKWDEVPIEDIAKSISGLSYKIKGSGKIVCSCPYHDDQNDSAVIIPKRENDKCAVFHCSSCGTIPLFEFYADQIHAINGGEASAMACQYFGIPKEYAVIGNKNSAALKHKEKKPKEKTSKSSYKDPELSEESVLKMHEELMTNRDVELSYIKGEKGATDEILKHLKIGWFDRGKGDGRYIFPVRDSDGNLVNYRQYNPKQKLKWLGVKDVLVEEIFPHEIDPNNGIIVIVEGEGDVLCARSYGINAYTGTAGAGTFLESWCERFKGMDVVVCYDNDSTGLNGSILASERLLKYASSVKLLRSPSKKPKGDITDWLMTEGGSYESFMKLIDSCNIFENEESLLESCSDAEFKDLMNLKPGSRVRTKMKIFQVDSQAGMVSSRVLIKCDRGTKKLCDFCPAENQDEFIIDTTPQNIDYMQTHQITTEESRIKRMLGLKCADISTEFNNKYNLYRCSIYHPDSPFSDCQPIEDCVIVSDEHIEIVKPSMFEAQIEVGQFPKAGAGRGIKHRTHFAFKPKKIKTEEESFNPVTMYDSLSVFQAKNGSAKEKILDIYDDLESKIAIYDRLHAVIVSDLCFLSAKEIQIQQGIFTEKIKGVLEVALFGSTRTGKSKISERLSQLYKFGQIYDCANLSHAALVGMASSTRNGGKFSPGILPKSDGSLIILDEADKYPDEQKFQKLTATRSSGIARYNKLDQSRAMPARVRMIWIANPPRGHKMDDYTYPFEIFRDVMIQDSAVSRFDFAIPIVSKEFIRKKVKDKKKYKIKDYRNLCLFARSLDAESIHITDDAEEFINTRTSNLFAMFGKDKGPVSNDIEEKIMRIATAIAIRLFSFDKDSEKLIVTEEHVSIAYEWMIEFHSSDTCGYDKMHQLEKELETTIRNIDIFIDAMTLIGDEKDLIAMCDAIIKNIGRIEFDADLLMRIFPQRNFTRSGEFFNNMINSGAIFSFKGESSKFKTKYKFSKDGLIHIQAVKDVGSVKHKIIDRVNELKGAEQQELEFGDDVTPF